MPAPAGVSAQFDSFYLGKRWAWFSAVRDSAQLIYRGPGQRSVMEKCKYLGEFRNVFKIVATIEQNIEKE